METLQASHFKCWLYPLTAVHVYAQCISNRQLSTDISSYHQDHNLLDDRNLPFLYVGSCAFLFCHIYSISNLPEYSLRFSHHWKESASFRLCHSVTNSVLRKVL